VLLGYRRGGIIGVGIINCRLVRVQIRICDYGA